MRLARPLQFGLAALLVALALGVALRQIGPASAATDGAMALDCDASTPAIDTACSYGPGATFSIIVNATAANSGGYAAYQAKVRWADATLDYLPAADPATENQWLACAPPAGFPGRVDNQPGDPSVLPGCATAVTGTYTGALVKLQMQCQTPGTTALTLVPSAGDSQGGSVFFDAFGSPIIPDPALTNASVTCQAPGGATNTPGPSNTPSPTNLPGGTGTPTETTLPGATGTPSPTNLPGGTGTPTQTTQPGTPGTPTQTTQPGATDTPTSTPTLPPETPTATPTPVEPGTATPAQTPTPVPAKGDVNNDGRTNSIDAALVLQYDAGLIHSLPNLVNADVNHNGAVNSVDAALILQFDAGLIHSLPNP
jgi:hypothetical protein